MSDAPTQLIVVEDLTGESKTLVAMYDLDSFNTGTYIHPHPSRPCPNCKEAPGEHGSLAVKSLMDMHLLVCLGCSAHDHMAEWETQNGR